MYSTCYGNDIARILTNQFQQNDFTGTSGDFLVCWR